MTDTGEGDRFAKCDPAARCRKFVRCFVDMRSPEQDPTDKTSDRPLMRLVTIALSPRSDPVMPAEDREHHAPDYPSLQGRKECFPKDGERRVCSCATPGSELSTGGVFPITCLWPDGAV